MTTCKLCVAYFRFSVVLKDSDKLVFALLRKSLDVEYEIDSRLLVSADWGAVFDMCVAHGVAGVCFGAVESLPKGCRPGVEVLMRWIGHCAHLESCYEGHLRTVRQLAGFFAGHGIRTMLMKGYGLSLCYPVPNRRQSGDIDVFLSDGERADELIMGLGIAVKQNEEKHSTYFYGGVHVENHASVVCELEHGSLAGVEEFLEEELGNSSSFDARSGCYLPSAMFNAVFLPLHLGGHFVFGGACLRQVVDYALAVRCASVGEIDWERVRSLAVEGGYWGFVCCLNGICVDYLGIPEGCFPMWGRDVRLESRVLDEILYARDDEAVLLAGKVLRYVNSRWRYNLVYGRESHIVGFFRRVRSWLIWKWGIGRNNVWD